MHDEENSDCLAFIKGCDVILDALNMVLESMKFPLVRTTLLNAPVL